MTFDEIARAVLARRAKRDAFASGIYREEIKASNPKRGQGGMPHDARFLAASGRANAGAFKLSGPVVPFGMTYSTSTKEKSLSAQSKNQCPQRDAKGRCVCGAACRKA